MTCEHGFIGACAECDNCWQEPAYDIAECGGCGEMTPVCCDTADGPYCAVCCPREHGIVGRSEFGIWERGWQD